MFYLINQKKKWNQVPNKIFLNIKKEMIITYVYTLS